VMPRREGVRGRRSAPRSSKRQRLLRRGAIEVQVGIGGCQAANARFMQTGGGGPVRGDGLRIGIFQGGRVDLGARLAPIEAMEQRARRQVDETVLAQSIQPQLCE
jgi:hypothetical protein